MILAEWFDFFLLLFGLVGIGIISLVFFIKLLKLLGYGGEK